MLCELIYILLVWGVGTPLFGEIQMFWNELLISLLDTALIIISFCSIFVFISMICSEITLSTAICIILFVVMFILQAVFGSTASSPKYITNTYWDENGNGHIISQEPNPNYPGEGKVKMARVIYFLIPQGQAMEVDAGNPEYLRQMPIYSAIIIIVINALGIYIFLKKELK